MTWLLGATALLATPPHALSGPLFTFTDEHGVLHCSNIRSDPRYGKTFGAALGQAGGFGQIVPPERMDRYVWRAAQRHRLDPVLIRAIIQVESGGWADARSAKGALGLMQLMPGTASELSIADPLDPEANILGGAEYLRRMLDRFQGDLLRALAAYNAGPGAVERANGIPPFPETRRYLAKVLHLWRHFKTAELGLTHRSSLAEKKGPTEERSGTAAP